MILLKKVGQMSDKLDYVIEIILRRLHKNDIAFSGVLLLQKMEHAQLYTVRGKPFLISSDILICFQIVHLEHSICASSDQMFKISQVISQMNPGKEK